MTLLAQNDRHIPSAHAHLAHVEPAHIIRRKRALRRAMFDPMGSTSAYVTLTGRLRVAHGATPPKPGDQVEVRGVLVTVCERPAPATDPMVFDWFAPIEGGSLFGPTEERADVTVEQLRSLSWVQSACLTGIERVVSAQDRPGEHRTACVGRAMVDIYGGAVVGVRTHVEDGELEIDARCAVQDLLSDAMDLPSLQLAEGRPFNVGDEWWFDIETLEDEGDGAAPNHWRSALRSKGVIPRMFDEEALVLARVAAAAVRSARLERRGLRQHPRTKYFGPWPLVRLVFDTPVRRLDGLEREEVSFLAVEAETMPAGKVRLIENEDGPFELVHARGDEVVFDLDSNRWGASDQWLRAVGQALLLDRASEANKLLMKMVLDEFVQALRWLPNNDGPGDAA